MNTIIKVKGNLCDSLLKLKAKNQELRNIHFLGQAYKNNSLERKYGGKIDKAGLDLLHKMLEMNPKKRITAEEALQHSYFNSFRPKQKVKSRTNSPIFEKHQALSSSNYNQ